MNDDFDVENDHLMIGQNEIASNCLWNVFRGEIGQKSETKPDHKIAVVDMESVARKAGKLGIRKYVSALSHNNKEFLVREF